MNPQIRSPALILAFLTALNLLNYLDRYVVAAVLVPMQSELGLSNTVAGLLPSIFLIGYSLTSPVFGAFVDRAGPGAERRRNVLLALGVGGWSAATLASGLAQSPAALVASRAVVGLGEASYTTLAPTVIDDVAPRGRTSAWMAIFYAATPIGSALGYIVGGAVLRAHGWRSAFFVAGFPGLVLALGCLALGSVRRTGEATRKSGGPNAASLIALLRTRVYLGAVLGFCAETFAIGGLAFWAPKYLHIRYQMAPGSASVSFGLLTVAGGAIGTLCGGALADRSVRARLRTREANRPAPPDERDAIVARANLVVCAWGCGLGAPLAAVALLAPTAVGFFVAAFACQVCVFLLSGPINVSLLRAAPPAQRASAMATSIFAIHAFGDLWSPGIIGALSDVGPMQTALLLVPAGFAVAACLWAATARSVPEPRAYPRG